MNEEDTHFHTNNETVETFRYLLSKLKDLAEDFDKGDHHSVIFMSAALRTMLKTKGKETISLVDQLGLGETDFFDSRKPEGGICGFMVDGGVSNQTITVPCDISVSLLKSRISYDAKNDNPNCCIYHFEPLLDGFSKPSRQKFSEWYDQSVYRIGNETLSRKDLIESICDKEGGAHFDKKLGKEPYISFRKGNASHIVVNGKEAIFEENPAFVSLRQIVYEVLLTFKDWLS